MNKHILTIAFFFCLLSSAYSQKFFIGYGTELDFFQAKYDGVVNSSFEGKSHSYILDINEMETSFSWSTMKFGYLTKNNLYLGANASLIFPLLGDGRTLKENLWTERTDISSSVYGDGSITDEGKASYVYSRFFGIDLGYNLKFINDKNPYLSIIPSASIYVHDRYFGEVVETFRYQSYSSGRQSDLFYERNGEYKNHSFIGVSGKVSLIYKSIYIDLSLGQVNSIGVGVALTYDTDSRTYSWGL